MNIKKLIITGLTIGLLTTPFSQASEASQVNEKSVVSLVNAKKEISSKQVVSLSHKFASTKAYVQSGGSYKEGEYKSFMYKDQFYRFLSSDIDTKKELLKYLKRTLTHKAAEQFIEEMGIIEYNGKLAQLEADGGSLLQWEKAETEYIKTEKNRKFYRITVPVGETDQKVMYMAEFKYVGKVGWRIDKEPYLDLDIPFNINPALIFFNYLLVDSTHSKEQLIDSTTFNVNTFKKGIKKVEVKELTEISRSKYQVEYKAKIYVELENGYKGSLSTGVNQLFFLIQQTNEMEFKIESIGTSEHLSY
ncbi:hypothetical protein IMZ08_13340 [Bacillus luteolus]|uniref:Uncharacterized protein n=1 Tax=Litchfieldia luteola TaxID=682179 RepID=A0ABR9QKP3_9BACI|nr:DL-endopeptidase inhibitor IseA family protein [Cytobacillus luteolus]MBE4909047.1 hypothetical protein [Cytobacillus luteolus]MBP1941903.1 hypothetical protein [Cytobacillus luteolus]